MRAKGQPEDRRRGLTERYTRGRVATRPARHDESSPGEKLVAWAQRVTGVETIEERRGEENVVHALARLDLREVLAEPHRSVDEELLTFLRGEASSRLAELIAPNQLEHRPIEPPE